VASAKEQSSQAADEAKRRRRHSVSQVGVRYYMPTISISHRHSAFHVGIQYSTHRSEGTCGIGDELGLPAHRLIIAPVAAAQETIGFRWHFPPASVRFNHESISKLIQNPAAYSHHIYASFTTIAHPLRQEREYCDLNCLMSMKNPKSHPRKSRANANYRPSL
jgi:hypothetical protein